MRILEKEVQKGVLSRDLVPDNFKSRWLSRGEEFGDRASASIKVKASAV